MKPSKLAMLDYIAGFVIFIISIIMFIVSRSEHVSLILLGLCGLNILWIIGIQQDLYGKEKK
jgi:hypothetical protein